jgi:tRNA(Leu) C34 or U34 (ribose-2'-O)-methylase TrmL
MGEGVAPAVGMVDPKFPHNVGAAVRHCTNLAPADAVGVTWGR